MGGNGPGVGAADNLFSPNFGQPTIFVDPRRAMVSVRVTWDGNEV